jgi:hypothetical protein
LSCELLSAGSVFVLRRKGLSWAVDKPIAVGGVVIVER